MKIFISMAMKDKSREEIIKKRDEVFQQIKSSRLLEAELIDSVLDISLPESIKDIGDNKAIFYLASSIQLIATADIVFFVDNCQHNSRGCAIEFDVANKYNKITHIIYTKEYEENRNKSNGLTSGLTSSMCSRN